MKKISKKENKKSRKREKKDLYPKDGFIQCSLSEEKIFEVCVI